MLKASYTASSDEREAEIINKIKDDPAAFYGYAKQFSNNRSDIGPLVDEDDNTTMDPQAMASLLLSNITLSSLHL